MMAQQSGASMGAAPTGRGGVGSVPGMGAAWNGLMGYCGGPAMQQNPGSVAGGMGMPAEVAAAMKAAGGVGGSASITGAVGSIGPASSLGAVDFGRVQRQNHPSNLGSLVGARPIGVDPSTTELLGGSISKLGGIPQPQLRKRRNKKPKDKPRRPLSACELTEAHCCPLPFWFSYAGLIIRLFLLITFSALLSIFLSVLLDTHRQHIFQVSIAGCVSIK